MSYFKINSIELGKRLKDFRLSKGLSQEELAIASDKYKWYISELESAKRNPRLDTISDILEAMGVTLFEFYNINPKE